MILIYFFIIFTIESFIICMFAKKQLSEFYTYDTKFARQDVRALLGSITTSYDLDVKRKTVNSKKSKF